MQEATALDEKPMCWASLLLVCASTNVCVVWQMCHDFSTEGLPSRQRQTSLTFLHLYCVCVHGSAHAFITCKWLSMCVFCLPKYCFLRNSIFFFRVKRDFVVVVIILLNSVVLHCDSEESPAELGCLPPL